MTVAPFARSARRYSLGEELFMAHQEQLVRFIASHLPAASGVIDAEDLAQETWLRIMTLGSPRLAPAPVTGDQPLAWGLPVLLCNAARDVVHAHLTKLVEWMEREEAAEPSATAA
ncbi:hypothetical protein ACWCV5_28300 [Streptomyces tubercidicus]